MKIKIEKRVLLEGIQAVQNIITPKSTLPILSNILVEAQPNKLRLTATDLEMGVNCVIPVDTQEVGAITIPAKRFNDIIRELPEDNIAIQTKKNNLITIETKTCQFKIMGLPPEEFPKLPEFQNIEVIKINQGVLKDMLSLTVFAASLDESRYILNGIFLEIKRDILTLVATDGKRLAVAERKITQNTEQTLKTIIPIKAVHELLRHLKEDGEVSFVLNNNQILFDLGDVVLISRLIEGEFPDYGQVIPPVSERKIRVDREGFLLALKRAALLATADYQAVKLEVFRDKLVVSKTTPDVGESREEVAVEYKDKEIAIGFNPNYLIDALKQLTYTAVDFEISDTEKPGAIRTEGYIYIVLPMRLA